jgi:sec-independent protein translocase protein TatA
MGFGGIGPGSLILILVIVILLFGTKKLRNIGSDLGGGLRNFRKSMKEGESTEDEAKLDKDAEGNVIEGEVTSKEKDKV